MLGDLLRDYDLFHSSIINGGKVKFNINYLLDGKVYISLVAKIGEDEKKVAYDFIDDQDFRIFSLPKILQRFLSKNVGLSIRKIMGNQDNGTMVIQRRDLKDCLIIRNCSNKVMKLAEILFESLSEINNVNTTEDSKIIFQVDTHQQHDDYMKYNIAFDFAYYKTQFFRNNNSENMDSEMVKENETEQDPEQLLLLNIARYAYTFESVETDVWDEIIKSYSENKAVIDICNNFKNNDFNPDSLCTKALILAEYEKNNDLLIHHEDIIIEEALEACNKMVNYFNSSYLVYFRDREMYYASILDGERQAICLDFIGAHDLSEDKKEQVEVKNRIQFQTRTSNHDRELLSRFRKIKEEKASFASIINDPIKEEDIVEREVEKIFFDFDKEKLLIDAEEQAKRIFEIEKERDQLKRDAEEFAKIILQNEKEHKKIVEAAEEQAQRIIELEKENEELKKLAENNAKYIFEREQKIREEEDLREYINNMPVMSQDIDKINNLLNSISVVKELDFAVNHPTVMQELMLLEEKIITYLTTHQNIVSSNDTIVPIEKEEMIETKPVIELLAMIRNAYVSSHSFEIDGRHTVISFNPVDDDTFRVSLFSVKDNSEDTLMDVFFEEYQLTDNVLEELCNIFKKDAVIVASKIDNVPPDKADYLVIDNMNNAIKFMDCKRELIEKVKEYI